MRLGELVAAILVLLSKVVFEGRHVDTYAYICVASFTYCLKVALSFPINQFPKNIV